MDTSCGAHSIPYQVSKETLGRGKDYFTACGCSSENTPVVKAGLEGTRAAQILRNEPGHSLTEEIQREVESSMVGLTRALVGKELDGRAFVFECTNLPPYSDAVKKATGLPVFDTVTLINMAHSVH